MSNIKDVTLETFERDVLQASRSTPVVVDFWADWCAPCRALKPVLEKLAAEQPEAFTLAKIDTEAERELAARFAIRSIPHVKAFVDGKIAAEFSGALPESAVRAFLAKLVPSPAEKLRRAARAALTEGRSDVAAASLREALSMEPSSHDTRLELAEVLLDRKEFEQAGALVTGIPERERDARAEALVERIDLLKRADSLPSAEELTARIADKPGDHELRLALGERLVSDRCYEPALEQLIEVVRADRGTLRDRARKLMVEVFNVAGAEEFVGRYRRMLASALY
jgi:putative thioredoxin